MDSEKRQSNFELLRILCMFLIVMFHMAGQTGMNSYLPADGANYYYCVLTGSAGRLVCNTFVMIGAWFLADRGFRPERAVNLWLEIFLYSVPITAACLAAGREGASITKLVQAFFPVFGRPVWFGAEYICLLLLTPWLNEMLDVKNRHRTVKVVKLFGVLIIGCATLFPIDHTAPAFSELVWFCFLYLFIGLYKHGHIIINSQVERYSLWLFVPGYLFLCGIKVAADVMNIGFLRRLYSHYMGHYEAFPGFALSFLLFMTFKNWQTGYSRLMNLVSKSTFAVYTIHQTPAFYMYMWNGIFHVDAAVESGNIIGYSLYVTAVVFAACVGVDNLRLWIMRKTVYKSRAYGKACRIIEGFYGGVTEEGR